MSSSLPFLYHYSVPIWTNAGVDPAVPELVVPTRSEVTRVSVCPEGLAIHIIQRDVQLTSLRVRFSAICHQKQIFLLWSLDVSRCVDDHHMARALWEFNRVIISSRDHFSMLKRFLFFHSLLNCQRQLLSNEQLLAKFETTSRSPF